MLTGPTAYQDAKKKATYGHKSWIVWCTHDGEIFADYETPSSIKRAMLALGTQGRWTTISGRGLTFVQRWRDGVRAIKNSKYA
jgi:hypothetical protein